MTNNTLDLPKDLGDGLTLRWGTPAEAEALAEFNVAIHSDDPKKPELWLGLWTKELMDGTHPTTIATDFTIVENEEGKIVSSMNLIPQTWAYEGVEFSLARPELVGTDSDYRRRGLVRVQFEAIHALSAARGHLVQGITGIPWYYRQFGYEMTVELFGSKMFRWDYRGNGRPVEKEHYQSRPAEAGDLEVLKELYGRFTQNTLLHTVRDDAHWQYDLFERNRDIPYCLDVSVVMDESDTVIGYYETKQWGDTFNVRELGVAAEHSLREVALFITRDLKAKADVLNEKREKGIIGVIFTFGSESPIYEALGSQLQDGRPPYSWFMRVPKLDAFLLHIAPVLERRLANSPLENHTGKLRLCLFREFWEMQFEDGKLTAVTPYASKGSTDGDVLFPDQTFLHILFGHRSYEEVCHMFTDCHATNAEAPILLNILFPKRPSVIRPLG